MPHLSDVRTAKSSFQLTTILGVLKNSATTTIAKDLKPGASVWEAVNVAMTQVIDEAGKLVQPILGPENVMKSMKNIMLVSARINRLFSFFYSYWYCTLGHPYC